MTHLEAVKARLAKLQALKQAEQELANDPRYLEDLNHSIEACEKEIGWLENKPAGFEMVK